MYLDGVIVVSADAAKHLWQLYLIPATLRHAGLTLKLAKCKLFSDKVQYLGHVLCPGTFSVNETATKAVREFAAPANQTDIQSFLGLCNVCRRFVRDYTKIDTPLNTLMRKGHPCKVESLMAVE